MSNAGSAPNSAYGGDYGMPANGPAAGPLLCYANLQAYQIAIAGFAGGNNGQNFGAVTFSNVIDGLSNRAVFSERVMGIGTYSIASDAFDPLTPGGNESIIAGVTAAQETTPQAFYLQCKASPPLPANGGGWILAGDDDVGGTSWAFGGGFDSRYTHVMPPNTWSCFANMQQAHVASSRHPGGVNVAFCDGSVKFIKASIGMPVWWALGTMAGGELVSSDQY